MPCLSGPEVELLGHHSWLRSLGRKAKKVAGNVAVYATVVPTGGLSLLAKTKDRRIIGHAVATVARDVGSAAMVAERMAKRVIRRAAQKVLFHGDFDLFGGDTSDVSTGIDTSVTLPAINNSLAVIPTPIDGPDLPTKSNPTPFLDRNAAIAVLTPAATAAVAATIPIAAPSVPILVPQVVDEVYDSIGKSVKAGATPAQAIAKAKAGLTMEDDVMLGLGAVALIGLGIFLIKRRKKSRSR